MDNAPKILSQIAWIPTSASECPINFLKFARDKLKENNFYIANLDINFICEKPNINKYRKKMISKLSLLLKIPEKIISIKATSNEKIGFIGDGLGIAAESIIQITNDKLY